MFLPPSLFKFLVFRLSLFSYGCSQILVKEKKMEVLIRAYHCVFQEILIHMFLVSFCLLLKLASIDDRDLKTLYLSLFV